MVALASARAVVICVPRCPSAPVTATVRPEASTSSAIVDAFTPAPHLYGHELTRADGVGAALVYVTGANGTGA